MPASLITTMLVSAIVLTLSSCRDDSATVLPDVTTTEYAWFQEYVTPAGTSTLRRSGAYEASLEQFLYWNNRKWRTSTEMTLAPNGTIASLQIAGTSAFGAPIDEQFEVAGGIAKWATLADQGSSPTDGTSFYISAEPSLLATSALVSLAAQQGHVNLLPAGRASVEKVHEKTLETGSGEKHRASLWMIDGLSIAPTFVWLDDHMQPIAFDAGPLGMIRSDFAPAHLRELSQIQSDEAKRIETRKARDLAFEPRGTLVFQHVDVVDIESGALLSDRSVAIAQGKITAVTEGSDHPPGATLIDARGLTMIPGLWDMHGHFGLEHGIINIAGGVTSVRDLGNVHEKIMEATAAYDDGTAIGPHTYRAGFIDKAGPFATGFPVNNLEEALQRVDFYADNGYVQIKLYSSIEPEWVPAIAERARARGLRLSGHIPAFMSAEQAVRAGYDEIQHINMVFLNFLGGDALDTREQIRFTLFGDEGGNLDLADPAVQSFIDLLNENDVVIDPTAAIFNEQHTHARGEPNPMYASIISHLPPTTARRLYIPEFDRGDRASAWERTARKQAAMLKRLHDAGVQLVPGSDAMPAFTIHRELELYAQAGIANPDVLRIATLESAQVLGLGAQTGSIEAGKDADLVLLDGNPLADISAIRRARLVIKGGILYQPDKLFESAGIRPFVPSLEVR